MELITAVVTRTLMGPFDTTWLFCLFMTLGIATGIAGWVGIIHNFIKGK